MESIVHYHESRSEAEAAAEIDSADEAGDWLLVPKDLVSDVKALIRAHESRPAS